MSAVALLLLFGAAPGAFADDPCAPPDPSVRMTRKWVERTVTVPAVTRTVRRPVYADKEVPVYVRECACVPCP